MVGFHNVRHKEAERLSSATAPEASRTHLRSVINRREAWRSDLTSCRRVVALLADFWASEWRSHVRFTSYGVPSRLRCLCWRGGGVLSPSLYLFTVFPLFLSPSLSLFVLPLRLSPSSGLCISVHPCMEIDLRREYITTSHPCIHPPSTPLLTPSLPASPLHRPISQRSLSQHLSQSSDLMHFNRHVYLPLALLSPSLLWLWISGILQTNNNNNNNRTSPTPPPPSPTLPSPLFLNQYLPSANKSYNFLTVRRVRRRHIYLQLVSLFSAVDPSFWRRGY